MIASNHYTLPWLVKEAAIRTGVTSVAFKRDDDERFGIVDRRPEGNGLDVNILIAGILVDLHDPDGLIAYLSDLILAAMNPAADGMLM